MKKEVIITIVLLLVVGGGALFAMNKFKKGKVIPPVEPPKKMKGSIGDIADSEAITQEQYENDAKAKAEEAKLWLGKFKFGVKKPKKPTPDIVLGVGQLKPNIATPKTKSWIPNYKTT